MTMRRLLAFGVAMGIAGIGLTPATAQDTAELKMENAVPLSEFGGRAAFSPDGKRIAFVDRTYGDAFEIEIATGKLRNLTRDIPHNGIVRIQYLPTGDYLVTAPHDRPSANTRAHLEMWFLDKSLAHGLQPLGEQVFEGIAVSRKRNLLAWTVIEPELKPTEGWQLGFVKPTKRYLGELAIVNGRASLSKREMMAKLPTGCTFIEPQDFRENDSELVYSCMGPAAGGGFTISVMGTRLATDEAIVYRRQPGEYNEVEGIAPGGNWAAVECGKQDKPGLPPLDICRLDLTPGGKLTRLIAGATPGSSSDVSNPVISPDGKWMAYQRSNNQAAEIGEGYGIYVIKLNK